MAYNAATLEQLLTRPPWVPPSAVLNASATVRERSGGCVPRFSKTSLPDSICVGENQADLNGILLVHRARLRDLDEHLQTLATDSIDTELACQALRALVLLREVTDALTPERGSRFVSAESVQSVSPLP